MYAEGGLIAKDVEVRNADVLIRQRALNLASPFPELLAQVAELARNVAAGARLASVKLAALPVPSLPCLHIAR